MKDKIKNIVSKAIADKTFPGCVVGVVKGNGERIVIPSGNLTFELNSAEIKEDSIFDVASITKSIPTSSLALKLIDEGRLNLEDKLVNFLPEINNSDREKVLIKHLLTQTLDHGFRLSENKNKTPKEILNLILTSEFRSSPGSTFFYSNATTILLGLVVEKILGDSLDNLGQQYFFEPLKMTRTSFNPLKKFSKDEIVPTEIQEWRGGLVHGEVHDESAHTLNKMKSVGSAGLFSTAPDLLNFLGMLLNKGTLDGKKYFSPEIIDQMYTNQIPEIKEFAGLGWEINQPHYMGVNCSDKIFGKTGFTGCVVMCDIQKEIAIVILSNYTYPVRKPDFALMNKLRSTIADIVLS